MIAERLTAAEAGGNGSGILHGFRNQLAQALGG